MRFKTRTRKKVEQEMCIASDKVWYDRHQFVMQNEYPQEKNPNVIKCIEKGEKVAKKMEKEYGKKNLGPYTKFESEGNLMT